MSNNNERESERDRGTERDRASNRAAKAPIESTWPIAKFDGTNPCKKVANFLL